MLGPANPPAKDSLATSKGKHVSYTYGKDLQTYKARTGRAFPIEWKAPTFLRIFPDSHWEELVQRFQSQPGVTLAILSITAAVTASETYQVQQKASLPKKRKCCV